MVPSCRAGARVGAPGCAGRGRWTPPPVPVLGSCVRPSENCRELCVGLQSWHEFLPHRPPGPASRATATQKSPIRFKTAPKLGILRLW
ncbi:hypothetical protein SFR_5006 [Streptomyces sp. FR-008]|nr:hypothetical protein SFR_5006 [Streptomyces sp. FR-008]